MKSLIAGVACSLAVAMPATAKTVLLSESGTLDGPDNGFYSTFYTAYGSPDLGSIIGDGLYQITFTVPNNVYVLDSLYNVYETAADFFYSADGTFEGGEADEGSSPDPQIPLTRHGSSSIAIFGVAYTYGRVDTNWDGKGGYEMAGNIPHAITFQEDILFFDGTNTYPGVGEPFSLEIATVPEPKTWAMMLVGFAGLGAAVRSRRRFERPSLVAGEHLN